jgi:hypothetical protein
MDEQTSIEQIERWLIDEVNKTHRRFEQLEQKEMDGNKIPVKYWVALRARQTARVYSLDSAVNGGLDMKLTRKQYNVLLCVERGDPLPNEASPILEEIHFLNLVDKHCSPPTITWLGMKQSRQLRNTKSKSNS